MRARQTRLGIGICLVLLTLVQHVSGQQANNTDKTAVSFLAKNAEEVFWLVGKVFLVPSVVASNSASQESARTPAAAADRQASDGSADLKFDPILELLDRRCQACHAGDNRVVDSFDLADRPALLQSPLVKGDDPAKWPLIEKVFRDPNHADRSLLVTAAEVRMMAVPPEIVQDEELTLIRRAVSEPRCRSLLRWSLKSGVLEELNGPGPYTIFAPTNEAIAKLSPTERAYLEQNPLILKDVLMNHGVAEEFRLDQLKAIGSVETVAEITLSIVPESGDVYVGNAKIVEADLLASNGVIHLIDEVLLPPDINWPSPPRLPGPAGIWLVEIPQGNFQFGGTPGSTVEVSTFYMSEKEITYLAYASLMDRQSSIKLALRRENPQYFPVGEVSWYEAIEFCNALSEKENLAPYYKVTRNPPRGMDQAEEILVEVPDLKGRGYRLPTEAEWEYACRSNSETRFHFGSDPAQLKQYACFGANAIESTSDGILWRTHRGGSFQPNAYGLYDMYGNLAEWCFDWHTDALPENQTLSDPQGPTRGLKKVVRGGSYLSREELLGSDHRGGARSPAYKHRSIGFRVVRTADRTKRGASFVKAND